MRNVNPQRGDRWTNDERRVTGVRIRKYLMDLIGLYTANGDRLDRLLLVYYGSSG